MGRDGLHKLCHEAAYSLAYSYGEDAWDLVQGQEISGHKGAV